VGETERVSGRERECKTVRKREGGRERGRERQREREETGEACGAWK